MSGLRSIIETPQTRRCMVLLLTAADEATEACLYRLLRERLARTTAFSVGHRGTLRPLHARHFVVQPNGSGLASIVEVAVVTGC